MKKMRGKKWIAAALSVMLITGLIGEPLAGEAPAGENVQSETAVTEAAPVQAEEPQKETAAPAAEEKTTDAPAAQESEAPTAEEKTTDAPAAQESEAPAAEEKTTDAPAAQEETPAAQEKETPAAAQEAASEQNAPAGLSQEQSEGAQEAATGTAADEEAAASGEAGLEAALKKRKKAGSAMEETAEEEADEKAEPAESELSITLGQDASGAYYAFAYTAGDDPVDITYALTDADGNAVGTPVSDTGVTGSFSNKKYILEVKENVFGLTLEDMGKVVNISVAVKPSEGGEEETKQVVSAETVTLTEPAMTMPASVSYTAADTMNGLTDVSKVSGITFDTGSFRTECIVEKKDGSTWTAQDGAKALTAADGGDYRILIRTVLKEYYSNEFRVVVPATGVEVSGDLKLASKLTAKAVGPQEGGEPYPVTYEWFFGEAGTVLGKKETFTPALQDAVQAQTMALCVRVTDGIGNKFTKVVTLGPLDLSKAKIHAAGYTPLTYDGTSQIPTDAKIMLDKFEIPATLYITSAAIGKNTRKAGTAWMTVTGNSAYLTGAKDVSYQIGKEEQDIEKSDLKTSFTYNGKAQAPVLNRKIRTAGKLSYKNWRKKAADGTWKPIAGAPKDVGTYRVRVIVNPANGNYDKIILRKVYFTIHPKPAKPKKASSSRRRSSGRYVPQPAGKDLTVTNMDGESKGYALDALLQGDTLAQIAALTGGSTDLSQVDPENLTQEQLAQLEQIENADFILEVAAEPDKKEDGTDVTDENGNPVYSERRLHISTSYVKELESHGCSKIRFVLGDTAAQVSIASLVNNTAVAVRVAPLSADDLTEGEKAALARYGEGLSLYELQILREASGADITDDMAKIGAVEVLVDITESAVAAVAPDEILFLQEKRAEEPDNLTPVLIRSVSVTDKGKTYLKGTAPGSGIFGLPQSQAAA